MYDRKKQVTKRLNDLKTVPGSIEAAIHIQSPASTPNLLVGKFNLG